MTSSHHASESASSRAAADGAAKSASSRAAADGDVNRDAVAARLRAMRADNDAELDRLTDHRDVGQQSVGFGKRVGDFTTLAVDAMGNASSAKTYDARLAEIDRALAKLDEGSYGSCDSCGAVIHPERLEALPFATLCPACKSAAGSRRG